MKTDTRWSHSHRQGSSGRRVYPERCERRNGRQRNNDQPRKQVGYHRDRDSLECGRKRPHSDRYEGEHDRSSQDECCPMSQKKETCTIMLTNLAPEITEKKISFILNCLEGPQASKMVFYRKRGLIRCFAVLGFSHLQDATQWMKTNQYNLVIRGKSVQANYSKLNLYCADWFCKYCGVQNFGKMWSCYKCGVKKSKYPDPPKLTELKTDTLRLSNISPQTNVHGILFMLAPFAMLCTSNISLSGDKETGTEQDHAFIKLSSNYEASQLLTVLCDQSPLQMDGQTLRVNYARADGTELLEDELPKDVAEATAGPANTAAQGSSRQTASVVSTSQVTPPSSNNSNPTAVSAVLTTFPDTSKYKFDESTGYYYDSQAGLYYDPSSQFFYNSATQQYFYLDSEKQKLIHVQSESDTQDRESNKKKTKRKNKTPQQIVKEMQRWEKTQKDQKEQQRKNKSCSQSLDPPKNEQSNESTATGADLDPVPNPNPNPGPAQNPNPDPGPDADADADFSQVEGKREDYEMMCLVIQQLRQARHEIFKSDSVDATNVDTEPEEDGPVEAVEDEGRETDCMRRVCLVCQQQFLSEEALMRHQQYSDLHKQNLDIQRHAAFPEAELERRETELSHGAPERRDVYGVSEPLPPQRIFYQPQPATVRNYEQYFEDGPTRGDTEGWMFEAMSWQQSRGPGRHYQDISAPNSALLRTNSTGPGVDGSSYEASSSDTYWDTAHQDMFSRFKQYS